MSCVALVPIYPQPPGLDHWVLQLCWESRLLAFSLDRNLQTGIIRESHTIILDGWRFGRTDVYYYHPKDPQTHYRLQDAIAAAKRLGLIKES